MTEKQRIYKVLETAIQVYQNRQRKISTSELNNTLLPIMEHTTPPMNKDKVIRIKYITQLPVAYPTFDFICNLPQYVRDPYKRFLENKLREHFDYTGCPLQIYIRQK